jgi:hypothetical protein
MSLLAKGGPAHDKLVSTSFSWPKPDVNFQLIFIPSYPQGEVSKYQWGATPWRKPGDAAIEGSADERCESQRGVAKVQLRGEQRGAYV